MLSVLPLRDQTSETLPCGVSRLMFKLFIEAGKYGFKSNEEKLAVS